MPAVHYFHMVFIAMPDRIVPIALRFSRPMTCFLQFGYSILQPAHDAFFGTGNHFCKSNDNLLDAFPLRYDWRFQLYPVAFYHTHL